MSGIQSTSTNTRGTYRKLWPKEADKFRDHLLRLDKASRRMRFAHGVSDSFVEDYAERMGDLGSIVFAYIEDGQVRGAAELKKLGDTWGQEAEAAFSVEAAYQEQGIGTELMGRIIRAARNRGVQHIYLSCLAENAKMQAIARKYEAELHFEYGEVVGEIVPAEPNYFSLLAEAVDDRVGFMMTVLDLQRRSAKAA
jgi:RimJ/RimL family protein N-acetyltransferase